MPCHGGQRASSTEKTKFSWMSLSRLIYWWGQFMLCQYHILQRNIPKKSKLTRKRYKKSKKKKKKRHLRLFYFVLHASSLISLPWYLLRWYVGEIHIFLICWWYVGDILVMSVDYQAASMIRMRFLWASVVQSPCCWESCTSCFKCSLSILQIKRFNYSLV